MKTEAVLFIINYTQYIVASQSFAIFYHKSFSIYVIKHNETKFDLTTHNFNDIIQEVLTISFALSLSRLKTLHHFYARFFEGPWKH